MLGVSLHRCLRLRTWFRAGVRREDAAQTDRVFHRAIDIGPTLRRHPGLPIDTHQAAVAFKKTLAMTTVAARLVWAGAGRGVVTATGAVARPGDRPPVSHADPRIPHHAAPLPAAGGRA